MTTEDDAARGADLALAAVHAIADSDESRVLALLNEAPHAHVVVATAYLLSALRETVAVTVGNDPIRTAEALHAAANNTEDAPIAAAAVIINESLKREGLSDG